MDKDDVYNGLSIEDCFALIDEKYNYNPDSITEEELELYGLILEKEEDFTWN